MDVTFTDHGQLMKSMKLPYDSRHLINYCRRHFRGQRIALAYEAGCTGFSLYDQLASAGYCCLVVAPSMVPTAPGQRVKTNRLDAKKLSLALRGGELQSIYVPAAPYRSLRQLVHLRDTQVRQRMASLQRIKALFLLEGLPFPESVSGKWTRAVWENLRTLSCPSAVRFQLDRIVSMATFAQEQVRQTTREIRRFCKTDPQLRRTLELLCTVPGVGGITATHLMARVGDGSFIRNVRQLPAFIGVVPREDSTGDTVRRGPITHLGDKRLRAKLTQAAWAAIRQDTELRQFYDRIYGRHPQGVGAKKAITAVVDKLCRRIACILKNQTPYVPRDASCGAEKEKTARPQGTPRSLAETSAAA
jgi:transposase